MKIDICQTFGNGQKQTIYTYIKICELPTDTIAQLVRTYVRQAEVLGSNLSKHNIFNLRHVFHVIYIYSIS